MQRFIRERKTSYLRNVIISVLIFLLIFAGFGCGLTAMNKRWIRRRCRLFKCHNPECNHLLYPGRSYPQSLGYLKNITDFIMMRINIL